MGLFSKDAPKQQVQTVTQRYEPSPEQQRIFNAALPALESVLKGGLNIPNINVAGFTPAETAGQQAALGAAGGPVQDIASRSAGALRFALGPVLDVNQNPALQQAIDASLRPVFRSFEQKVLPGIADASIGAGQLGSTRQGVAQGIASQALLQTAGDTAGRIVSQAYEKGLDTLGRALALAPTTAQLQLGPALVQSGVGAQQRQLRQAQLDAERQSQLEQQLLPFSLAQSALNSAAGLNTGTATSSGAAPGPIQPSVGQRAISGAAAGAALAGATNLVAPGLGAALGAVLSLF